LGRSILSPAANPATVPLNAEGLSKIKVPMAPGANVVFWSEVSPNSGAELEPLISAVPLPVTAPPTKSVPPFAFRTPLLSKEAGDIERTPPVFSSSP
jgi:hypothetical protein